MSGTSMDGVDAVLCEFRAGRFVRVRSRATRTYPAALREQLLTLQRDKPAIPLDRLARLDRSVAEIFAASARQVLRLARVAPSRVAALGSHGQTVFHDPHGARSSLQLGDPSRIAALTGITTVADFRRADIALGGHGAPLVPAFHHAVFAAATPRAIVNIGGIANVTVLRGRGPRQVTGFDTGPGNGLLDEWTAAHRGQNFDRNGRWASTGSCHPGLLDALLKEPWFATQPPRSTGRDLFNLVWVRSRFPQLDTLAPGDVQRTLLEFTARTIADAVRHHGRGTREVFVCGGGSRNGLLMRRLADLVAPARVGTTAEAGLDPLSVEGAAFAWLAMRRLRGQTGSLPAVTGARRPAVLGGIYRP